MKHDDLLFELGTEELPPLSVQTLSETLAIHITAGLKKAELDYGDVHTFATPRRLAVIIKNIAVTQNNQTIEKRGPTLKAAFDTAGHPTLACLGFASACGTTVDQLITCETDKGAWLFFKQIQAGANTTDLLPELIKQAIQQLPIPKPMRWGNHAVEFIRPVHWAVLLFGEHCIKMDLFGISTGRNTFGHRFHHPNPIPIPHPNEYETLLRKQGFVIADFALRRQHIYDGVQNAAAAHGQALREDALLDEVTSLVEWPVPLLGTFDPKFLDVPPETVITAMQLHQRYFPVLNSAGELLPYFVMVSNIESLEPARVIAGNQRVIRARLSDAQFFYHSDLNHNQESRLDDLKKIIFQKKLGTLLDKSQRISILAGYLAEKLQSNPEQAQRAGWLCKMDLTTAMVGEFPELQGIMGYYYALKAGEPMPIALAIRDHYRPRFAKDTLPETLLGDLVSIADKIDTVVGLFGINQSPSGEKDPYGLRRAALGILRILIQKQLSLDLRELLDQAITLYTEQLENKEIKEPVKNFIMERLRSWYLDKGIDTSVFNAVSTLQITVPLDFHYRIQAVQHFMALPEADALITSNKRVSHLIDPLSNTIDNIIIDQSLFETEAEHALFTAINAKTQEVAPLYLASQYTKVLSALAELRTPIDRFFEEVMVMVDDEKQRTNRLVLLSQLQYLFSQVADIALLRV